MITLCPTLGMETFQRLVAHVPEVKITDRTIKLHFPLDLNLQMVYSVELGTVDDLKVRSWRKWVMGLGEDPAEELERAHGERDRIMSSESKVTRIKINDCSLLARWMCFPPCRPIP